MELENYLLKHLAKKPYCTDAMQEGLSILSKERAINKKYIQINQPNSKKFLVFDCDHEAGFIADTDAELPPPTWKTGNKENGRAHLVYGLKNPIHLNDYSKLKPIEYAAAIEKFMTNALFADPMYVGLMTKNPLNFDFRHVFTGKEYELSELVGFEPLLEKNHKKNRNREIYGLGRNCELFDRLRLWAYKAVTQEHDMDWDIQVLDKALWINQLFEPKISYPEVKAIAKSVAKWTVRKYSYDKRAWHQKQQVKSVKVKNNNNCELKQKAKCLREEGKSYWEIELEIKKPQSTIRDWLK